jgi:peptide/nickel transport system permease protein
VGTYVLRRLAQSVPVLLLASLAIFLMLRLIPGDPALVILGSDARPEQVRAVREELRLNDPLPTATSTRRPTSSSASCRRRSS